MRFVQIVRNVALAFLVAPAMSAHADSFYAANNGTDATFCGFSVIGGTSCGSKTSRCRSIQCAIAYAHEGDTVIVGPGIYGDVGRDGNLGDRGDESGSSGCDCMLSIDKPVIVVSSDGAGATIIDAEEFNLAHNVRIFTTGAEFGRPGKGFTVTSRRAAGAGFRSRTPT